MHRHRFNYEESPFIIAWEVTQACDLVCDHCRADAKPERHPYELTTQEGKKLIENINEFEPKPILVFSGGDPLKRSDLFELIEYADSIGLTAAVTPAPTDLLDKNKIDKLKSKGVKRMALSLDGGTAQRHDSFRGQKGSFDIIMDVAEYAKKIDLPVQINTTVTKSTLDDLPKIADLIEELGCVMWEVFFLVPIGRGKELEQLSPKEAEKVLRWLYNRQKEGSFKAITVEAPQYRRIAKQIEGKNKNVRVGSTGDGEGFLFISHIGEVYPSGFLPICVGNVREDDIVDLYQNSSFLNKLRDPDNLKGDCGFCRYKELCGGSRARAYAVNDNHLESDPLCYYKSLV